MLKYIVRRLFIFIPTLFAISLITFVISINSPGDPVEMMLNKNSGGDGQLAEKLSSEKTYNELRHKLGFDLPVFYFSITNATYCDTLYKISNSSHRAVLEHLSFIIGNNAAVMHYYKVVNNLELEIYKLPKTDSTTVFLAKAKDYINLLFNEYDTLRINKLINNIAKIVCENGFMQPAHSALVQVQNAYNDLLQNKTTYKKYIPVIHWYGFNNQYHRWLFGNAPWFGEMGYGQSKGFFRGDFGTSYQDKRPVSSVLWDAMGWTLALSLLSMFFAYLIAIPLGVISAVDKGSLKEKSITTTLFMLYSLPNFWVATLAVIFLCGGDWLSWFPSPGADAPSSDASFMEWLGITAYKLVLPLICWTYGSLAFISRQMRGGMLNVLGQDFIRTARAKGVAEKQVVWRHAFRNSLLPIITLFASIFPLAISGSFVIEYIFSIPGMGNISLEALIARNYPVVFTVMMFTAILTLIGNLVQDILYAVVDPRISFTKKG